MATFWSLLSNGIVIPQYQRDYAQGRLNTRAEQIRTDLVNNLCTALCDDQPVELDFVFGGNDSGSKDFSPVDGQQRLTMLFLLHWYVFSRAEEPLEDLKKFKYQSRDTSARFCENLCGLTGIEWNDIKQDDSPDKKRKPHYTDGPVAKYVTEQPWFTGAIGSDPTVQSMLVVLDEIHAWFEKKVSQSVSFDTLADRLKKNDYDCPITFLELSLIDLGGDDPIRDLYIKMNARGVPLTDFEIFKAQLEKSDLIDKKDKQEVIGKFNTEYADTFFSLIDGGEIKEASKFDRAMMNFINEFIRADFYCDISEKGVDIRKYNPTNDALKKFSGKSLMNFVETGVLRFCKSDEWTGKQGNKIDFKGTLKNSIFRSISVLNTLDNLLKNQSLNDWEKNLLINLGEDPYDSKSLTVKDMLARCCLYEYWISQNASNINYNDWRGFVKRMADNIPFREFSESIETLRAMKKILSDSITNGSLWKQIGNFKGALPSRAKEYFAEEQIKANLRQNQNWKTAIEDLESYFSDGQIRFALILALVPQKTDITDEPNDYNFGRFENAAKLLKEVFDNERQLKDDFLPYEFDAFLLSYSEKGERDHMPAMSNSATETRKLGETDYTDILRYDNNDGKNGRERAVSLLRALNQVLDNYPQQNNSILTVIGTSSSQETWKKELINLIGLIGKIQQPLPIIPIVSSNTNTHYEFTGCIEHLSGNNWPDDSIALYTTSKRRTDSLELHSYLLAATIQSSGKDVTYYVSSNDNYLDSVGHPNRYFTCNQQSCGYIGGKKYKVWNTSNSTNSMELEWNDVIKQL